MKKHLIATKLVSISLAALSAAHAEGPGNTVPSPKDQKLPVTAADAQAKKDTPPPQASVRPAVKPPVRAEKPAVTAHPEHYVLWKIRPGETLSRIGNAFAVDTRKIASLNHISDPDVVRSGEVIAVPVTNDAVYYTVMPSDTLDGIARSLSLPAEEIVKVNHIANADLIIRGARLLIPVGLQKATRSGANRHEVAMTTKTSPAAIDEQRFTFPCR